MKNLNKTLILFLTIFSIVSCQKDNEPYVYENKQKNLTAEEYLRAYTTPVVMFQYAEVDLQTNETTGMLINDSGEVFKYMSSHPLNDFKSSETSVSTLMNMLELSERTGVSIDIEELVDNYKKTRKVDVNNLSHRNVESNVAAYFIAYDLTYDSDGNEMCTIPGVSHNKYVQKLLKSNNVLNGSIHAKQIVKWMAVVLDKSDT